MTEHIDENILAEIERTHIIAVSVSEYENLENLPGAGRDLGSIYDIFVNSKEISLYSEDQITLVHNPSKQNLSEILLDYVHSRSARGDILIFYFSGHGYVSGNGEFSLCLRDSISGYDDSGLLPLSTLSFGEIVKSLSAVDVYTCFIIDACFSAASTKVGHINVGVQIEYEASQALGNSYAVVASSSADAYSKETAEGGYFSRAFSETILEGLDREDNSPHISLKSIPKTIDTKLSQLGVPLSRLHIGLAFPEIALAINKNFDPRIRIERFTRAYKALLLYAWNDGILKCFTMEEIRQELPSGYGNHRKFEYIWGLLCDSRLPDGKACRALTPKGVSFIRGEIAIYRSMRKDPANQSNWIPVEGTEEIFFEEI